MAIDIAPYLISYSVFLFFIVTISSMGAPRLISNAPDDRSITLPPVFPSEAPGVLGFLSFVLSNVWYFFVLMSVDFTYAAIGFILFTPFALLLFLYILGLIRGGS
jgi:ABC-type polysaccharide/polyol phosphate export permease